MNIFLLFLIAMGIFLVVLGVYALYRLSLGSRRLNVIESALNSGKYREALDMSTEYLKDKRSFIIYYYIARAYEGLKDFPRAVKFYEDSITYFSQEIRKNLKIDILIRIGNLYNQKKDYVMASGNYLLALQENPTEIRALYQLSEIYFNSKNYQKAISNLEKLILIKPEFWQALNLLGKACSKTGNSRRAVYAFESALKLPINDNHDKNNIYFELADVYYNMKNYREAINVLKLLLNDPEYLEESLLKILKSMILNNQLKEAIQMASAYLTRISNKYKDQALYIMGRAYFGMGEYLQAIDSWVKAYMVNPDYADLKELMARYKVLVDNPLLEDYFSKDETIFNDFIYNYLKLHTSQVISSEKNFKIYKEGNARCHIFYRVPYAMNAADLKRAEEVLVQEYAGNMTCLLYTLFSTTPDCRESGFYKQVQEISGDQFVLTFFKHFKR
jgi:tetratricopeptide (TPR) repeat protein